MKAWVGFVPVAVLWTVDTGRHGQKGVPVRCILTLIAVQLWF